jgi:hypothetical protein
LIGDTVTNGIGQFTEWSTHWPIDKLFSDFHTFRLLKLRQLRHGCVTFRQGGFQFWMLYGIWIIAGVFSELFVRVSCDVFGNPRNSTDSEHLTSTRQFAIQGHIFAKGRIRGKTRCKLDSLLYQFSPGHFLRERESFVSVATVNPAERPLIFPKTFFSKLHPTDFWEGTISPNRSISWSILNIFGKRLRA